MELRMQGFVALNNNIPSTSAPCIYISEFVPAHNSMKLITNLKIIQYKSPHFTPALKSNFECTPIAKR